MFPNAASGENDFIKICGGKAMINLNDRAELLKKVQAAEFAAYDLLLYLDTHPNCQKALTLFKEKCAEAKKARADFEEKYGPLTACASCAKTPWQWIKNPWVWDKSE